jgi:hypothetical protein
MATAMFDDFGQLYRAAFAECDPEIKSRLLSEVRQALAEWERNAEESSSTSGSHFWTATTGDSAA